MNAFTALIYIKSNTANDEKIAVGLVASGIDKLHFGFSKNKLHRAFALANISAGNPIEKYFKNIGKSITEANFKDIYFSENYILNKEYVTYLNRYDSGIIYFEKPAPLSTPLNDAQYEDLYKLMIGEPLSNKNINHEISFSKSIRTHIEKRQVLKEKADVIYSVDPNTINSIVNPVEIDYIAVNGAICAGMHVDFLTEANTIVKHMYEYKSLAAGLNGFSVKMKYKEEPNYNIYHNTPIGKEQKAILEKLLKDDSVRGINIKNSDLIEMDIDKIEKKDYRKFSTEVR